MKEEQENLEEDVKEDVIKPVFDHDVIKPVFDHDFDEMAKKMARNPIMILGVCQKRSKGLKGNDYLEGVRECLTEYLRGEEKEK